MAPVLTTGPSSRPLIRRPARCATACATNGAWIGCCTYMRLWRGRTSERRDGLTTRERRRRQRQSRQYPVVPSVRQGGGLERTPGPATQPGSGIAAATWAHTHTRTRTHTYTHTHTYILRTYILHTTRESGRLFVTQVRTHIHTFDVPRSAKALSRPCQGGGGRQKMGWWRTGSATAATR